jgi:hypothetical protein
MAHLGQALARDKQKAMIVLGESSSWLIRLVNDVLFSGSSGNTWKNMHCNICKEQPDACLIATLLNLQIT